MLKLLEYNKNIFIIMKRLGYFAAISAVGVTGANVSLGKGWERYGDKYERNKASDKHTDLWNNL